jgi:hypothetical protein
VETEPLISGTTAVYCMLASILGLLGLLACALWERFK